MTINFGGYKALVYPSVRPWPWTDITLNVVLKKIARSSITTSHVTAKSLTSQYSQQPVQMGTASIDITRSSALFAEGPRDAICQLKSYQLLHNCNTNRIWSYSGWLKNGAIWWAIYCFVLVVCNYNVSVLHSFRDNTTCTAYVTDCHLEKSFSFNIRQCWN